jgi:hypothetical protein
VQDKIENEVEIEVKGEVQDEVQDKEKEVRNMVYVRLIAPIMAPKYTWQEVAESTPLIFLEQDDVLHKILFVRLKELHLKELLILLKKHL